MAFFKKKIIAFIVFFLLANLALAAWVLVYDLKIRFPNLDLSKSRVGTASWYSEEDKNVNPETANGEKFDDEQMTCASWDYPFGERLAVVNVLTGKWVVCRVNDRGPNKRFGRVVDLTQAAFRKIANPKKGLIYVTVVPVEKQKARSP